MNINQIFVSAIVRKIAYLAVGLVLGGLLSWFNQ